MVSITASFLSAGPAIVRTVMVPVRNSTKRNLAAPRVPDAASLALFFVCWVCHFSCCWGVVEDHIFRGVGQVI